MSLFKVTARYMVLISALREARGVAVEPVQPEVWNLR
jgi:hypothetical protein